MALSYVQFLGVALAPPLLALGAATALEPREWVERRPLLAGVGLIAALALVYTTPWDNYLIARGVWTYGADRAGSRLWLAPVAEYLFILGQTLLVSLWTLRWVGSTCEGIQWRIRDAVAGAAAGVAVGLLGLGLLSGRTFYLGAILAWAGPVLALQWAVGWRYLWAVRRRVAVATLVPAGFLSAIDAVAIADGLWTIAPETSTGYAVLGLPIEEAVFFAVTSLFVVQGLTLLPWVIERWR